VVKVLKANVPECEAEKVVVGPAVPVVENFPAGHLFVRLGSAALRIRAVHANHIHQVSFNRFVEETFKSLIRALLDSHPSSDIRLFLFLSSTLGSLQHHPAG
jgi:hypothetical protein